MNDAISRPGQGLRTESELPIACDPPVFSEDARRAHLRLSTDVLVRWPRQRVELADGYAFRYEGDEAMFLTLARWAASEHRCCPWGTYSVEMRPFTGGGEIEIRVTATEEGKAFLTEAYRYLEELNGEIPPASILNPKGTLTRKTLLDRLKGGCGC
jgi:hypothetical protein